MVVKHGVSDRPKTSFLKLKLYFTCRLPIQTSGYIELLHRFLIFSTLQTMRLFFVRFYTDAGADGPEVPCVLSKPSTGCGCRYCCASS